jgi:endonuclease YncB( thermonuclease family)
MVAWPAGWAPTIVDGDTLRIGRESIRLQGIDAPELRQTCADGWHAGDAARRALAGLVAAGAPQCERVTTDRYGRTVAICRVNGEDIGAAMVRRGMAWAYSTYSWRYLSDEWLAWFEGAGVHARHCASPSAWRAEHPSHR